MAEPAKPSTAGCSARRWHGTGHHCWGHPVVRGGPRQDTSAHTHVLVLGIVTLPLRLPWHLETSPGAAEKHGQSSQAFKP